MMATQKTRMSQYADAAKDEAEGMYDQACERASAACRETENLVRRNPGSSALVTFGVGFGLGLLATHLLLAPQRSHRSSWLQNIATICRKCRQCRRDRKLPMPLPN